MTYLLLIELVKNISFGVGSLGIVSFRRGNYIYIGSAKKNLETRLLRHLSKNKKRFWHIDYLLSKRETKIKNIFITKLKECYIASIFLQKKYNYIKYFGSSDCSCISHLFFVKDKFIFKNFKINHFYKIN